MAFKTNEKLYPALNAAVDELQAAELPYVAAVMGPRGLYITEWLKDSEQARMLVGGIVAWFIREIVEVEGPIAAREWLHLAFAAAQVFLQPDFSEVPPEGE